MALAIARVFMNNEICLFQRERQGIGRKGVV